MAEVTRYCLAGWTRIPCYDEVTVYPAVTQCKNEKRLSLIFFNRFRFCLRLKNVG